MLHPPVSRPSQACSGVRRANSPLDCFLVRLTPLGQALLQHLQQNIVGSVCTIKCPEPTQQRPPGGQAMPCITSAPTNPRARLPALASVIGRSSAQPCVGWGYTPPIRSIAHPWWGRTPPYASNRSATGTNPPPPALPSHNNHRSTAMKGILAWAIGIPIPIIAILYFMDVF